MGHYPPLTFIRFLLRWLLSGALVFGTYNPSGYSYYHWLFTNDGNYLSLKVTVGLFIAGIYIALWPIIWGAFGFQGLFAAGGLMGTLSLAAWEAGLLENVRPSFYVYGLLVGVATVVAAGVYWGWIALMLWHVKLYRKIVPKRY
ncbi:membrane hypothetical protein [Azospirillaceae bacterium]